MDWTVLGIEPTKDKKAITAAYRGKLKHTNPEEKPEEFKVLRAAYEAALEYATQSEDIPPEDTTPVGLWMAKVRKVYNDFPARIAVASWEALLEEDTVLAMDTRPLAEEALLKFLMEDYFIPSEVWQLLDSRFHWVERAEELYETFPREFIDYAVINGVRLEPNLPYELFAPGIDGAACDTYRRMYHEATQVPLNEMAALLEQMDALPESHPYGILLHCRLDFIDPNTRPDTMAAARELAQTYPDNTFIQMEWASMCAMDGDWQTVEQATQQILERQPLHFMAKRLLADALVKRGAYDEGKEHIYELMRAVGGDQMQTYQLGQVLRTWNEELIVQKEALLLADPDDTKNVIELGWCYLQNDRFDDAVRMAKIARPDYEDRYDYYNFCSKVHYAREEYQEALENFYRLEAVMVELDPTVDEKTAKRKRRLPEVVQLQGSCLMALKREEEGKERYLKALELDPENAEILTYTARMFAGTKDYEAAIPLLEKVITLMPTSYHGHFLLAQVYYELNRDRDALDAVERALNYEGGDLGVYVLKMRIFLRNGVWEPVREIIAFLEEHKVGDEPMVLWCKAQLLDLEEGKRPEALALYQQVAEKMEAGAYLDWGARVYYRIANITIDNLDLDNQEDRDRLMGIVEKGLACDPEDPNCLEYKAWLLRRDDKVDEALEIYHKLEEYDYHPISVEYNLAELYYKNLKKNARQALNYYLKIIEKEETADLHFYAGTACRYLGDYEAAVQHFLREQALAPQDVDGYNGLSYVYEAMGRPEEALEQVQRAIELAETQEGRWRFLYEHKVQILRRLNRFMEADRTVLDAMERYEFPEGFELLFEIWSQAGDWSRAKAVLAAWKDALGPTSQWATASVRLLRLSGHPILAELKRGRVMQYLEEQDDVTLQLEFHQLQGRFGNASQLWDRRENWVDRSHVLMSKAMCEYFAGKEQDAVLLANRARMLLEEILGDNLTNEALYRTRYAMVLALLGQELAARRELEQARKLPLCAGCEYCSCKDADIYEAAMEEIFGTDDETLMKLYEQRIEQWPDETDFIIGQNRVKGRMRKKRKGK